MTKVEGRGTARVYGLVINQGVFKAEDFSQ